MRKFLRIFGIGVVCCALLAVAMIAWPSRYPPTPDPRTSRMIDNVRIVDVVAGTVGQPQSLLIREGRIAAIGQFDASPALPRHDEGGAYAVPAFWDMHMHSFQSSPQMHFPLWVANGVLNVRDMMDCPGRSDTLIACAQDKARWNREVAAGTLSAPRIVETASFYLARPDMAPAEARADVRRAKRRKIEAVKVYNDLPLDAYRAAAAEADAQGMKLVGHLPRAVRLEAALTAGQDAFEHAHILPRHCSAKNEAWRARELEGMSPTQQLETLVDSYEEERCKAAFKRLEAAEAWLVPTHVTREEDARAGDPAFIDDPRLVYLDPLSRWARNDDLGAVSSRFSGREGQDALDAYFLHGLALTKAAKDAGVNVLVGTDTALGGFRYHDELAHLARAGLSPPEILRAATIDAARYAGESETAGTLEVGKSADLVLLAANPLDSIAATRRIRAVVAGGRLYDRQRLDALLAFVSGQAGAPHNWMKLVWGFARSSMASEM